MASSSANDADADVSVVMPFLNAQPFLREAVDSVVAQTKAEWELILVDDGSEDGSTEIAQEYAASYPRRVSYVAHEGHANLGISASRNAGWSVARGESVLSVDADDVLLPQCLESLYRKLDAEPNAGAVQARVMYWHSWHGQAEDDLPDHITVYPFRTERAIDPPRLATGPLLGTFEPPCTCVTLYRRPRDRLTGPYEPSFTGLFEDQVAYFRVVLEERVYVTNEVVALYRQHPSSITKTVSDDDQARARTKFLDWVEAHLASRPPDPQVLRWLRQARRVQQNPTIARMRRSARRLGRIMRGLPPNLQAKPPGWVVEFARNRSRVREWPQARTI